jgi:hypothetical protein
MDATTLPVVGDIVNVPSELLTDDTALPDGVELIQVVPLLVRTFPLVLGATVFGAEVPLPSTTPFAVRLVELVPP